MAFYTALTWSNKQLIWEGTDVRQDVESNVTAYQLED